MISITTNRELVKVVRVQGASGCPALTGVEVNGYTTASTVRCEGTGAQACRRCEICNIAVPVVK